jgi:1,4-alpha-glucan branching enzyme
MLGFHFARLCKNMLADADVKALVAARHADPFAVLGLHTGAKNQLWLRALLPGAKSVDVINAVTEVREATLARRHADGLFEAVIAKQSARFEYWLKVTWADGHSGTYADAYAFGPQLNEADLAQLREGTHLRPYTLLGAHALTQGGIDGVRFALWAPNAKRVSVVGDFNLWDGRRHPMRLRHDAGVWEIFVPHAAVGDHYKFELLVESGSVRARCANASGNGEPSGRDAGCTTSRAASRVSQSAPRTRIDLRSASRFLETWQERALSHVG